MFHFSRAERLVTRALLLLAVVAPLAGAQGPLAPVNGRITDESGRPLEGAIVTASGSARTVQTNKDGAFTIDAPAGSQLVRARLLGFKPDSAVVDDAMREVHLQLRTATTSLSKVTVEAQRASGTAVSLARQRIADNLKSLTVAEEIRALPNANAADAVSRLPGVSLQRHEGEGAYAQVRGIDGNLSNVTINGAHIAGNFDDKGGAGSRVAKLDGIPAELLSMAQVSKTLTADQDADAIGGSVNIESKSADDAPGLVLLGTYARSDLQNAPAGLGAITYGNRFLRGRRLGLFIGTSYDRNNRIYDDIEPAYGYRSFNGAQVVVPTGISRREYFTQRKRSGLAFSTDYRFGDRSMIALKGLWTRFDDAAIRYRQDQNLTLANAIPASATAGTAAGGNVTSNVQQRTPIDENMMVGVNGTAAPGKFAVDYALSVTQNGLIRRNAGDLTFRQTGVNMSYDRSDPLRPLIVPVGAYPQDPTKYAFRTYVIANQTARGRDYSGQLNVKYPFATSRPSTLQFGVKAREEHRWFDDTSVGYALNSGQTFTLADVLGSFTNPNHYNGDYPMGISPNDKANEAYVKGHPEKFSLTASDDLIAKLQVYDAHERITAGYAAYTIDVGQLHWVAGLRVEQTHTEYTANKATTDNKTKVTSVGKASGSGNYANVFPSLQLRASLDDRTNLRLAVSTGIGRPLYGDLSPRASLSLGALTTDPNAVSLGNPALKPTRSINYDALVEHFSSDVGVIQAGVFYKQLQDFIYNHSFVYQEAPFVGYNATQPLNGKGGHIYGVEAAFVRRLAFLPGMLNGFGVDANATYTQSSSQIEGRVGSKFPRQADWNGNAALTYAKGMVSSRVTVQYNGPYIYTLGDATSSVATGDTYMMAHTQLDASVNVSVLPNAQVVIQALNLTNAHFGYFFANDPKAIKQSEFYGTTLSLQMRYTY